MNIRSLTLLAAAAGFLAAPVHAQSLGETAGQWNAPYGGTIGDESRAYVPGTRDANNNRVIVDGRILTGDQASSLPREMGGGKATSTGVGAATAIGNQLNVVTQGNWNTVIIDSTQTNNGDVVANASGEVLNGELNLDD